MEEYRSVVKQNNGDLILHLQTCKSLSVFPNFYYLFMLALCLMVFRAYTWLCAEGRGVLVWNSDEQCANQVHSSLASTFLLLICLATYF